MNFTTGLGGGSAGFGGLPGGSGMGQGEWLTYLLRLDAEPFVQGLNQGVQGLDKFHKQAKTQLGQTAQETKALGDTAKTAMTTFTGAFQAAAATLAALNMKKYVMGPANAFAQFQSTLNTYKAVSQATNAEMKALTAEIYKQGKATQYSSQKIAQTTVEMAKLGMNTEKSLKALPGVIAAASASGADLAFTAELVSGALAGFSLEAEKATLVADTLAQVANVSAADMSDLYYTFKFLAPVAKGSNQSLSEVAAAVSLLGNNLIKGSTAGTGLKNVLVSLQAPNKQVRKLFKELGVTADDGTGKMKRLSVMFGELKDAMADMSDIEKSANLEKIFGRLALPTAQVLMKTTREEFEAMTAQFDAVEGTSEKTANTINQGLTYAFGQLRSSIETAKIDFGAFFEGPMVFGLTQMKKMVDLWSDLPPPIKATAAAIIGLGAAFAGLFAVLTGGMFMLTTLQGFFAKGGPFAVMMGKMPGMFAAVTSKLKLLLGFLGKFKGFLLGAGAWFGAFYLAFKTNLGGIQGRLEKFGDWWKNSFLKDLKENFQGALNTMKGAIDTFIQGSMDTFRQVFAMLDRPANSFFNFIEAWGSAAGAVRGGDYKQAKLHTKEAHAHFKAFLGHAAAFLDKDAYKNMWAGADRDYGVEPPQKTAARYLRGGFKGATASLKPDEAKKKRKQQLEDLLETTDSTLDRLGKVLETNLNDIKGLEDAVEMKKYDLHGPTALGRGFTSGGGFGMRYLRSEGRRRMHYGQDIAFGMNEPVPAAAPGMVSFVGVDGGHGNTVKINHGGGYTTLYGHAGLNGWDKSRWARVAVGQRVKKGQTIMTAGNSGYSKGAHLHYSVLKDGVYVDPSQHRAAMISDQSEAALKALKKKTSLIHGFTAHIDDFIKQLSEYDDTAAKDKVIELQKLKSEKLADLRDSTSQNAKAEAEAAAKALEEFLKARKKAQDDLEALQMASAKRIQAYEWELILQTAEGQEALEKMKIDKRFSELVEFYEKQEEALEKIFGGGHISVEQHQAAKKQLGNEEAMALESFMRQSHVIPGIDDAKPSEAMQNARHNYGLAAEQLGKMNAAYDEAAKKAQFDLAMTEDKTEQLKIMNELNGSNIELLEREGNLHQDALKILEAQPLLFGPMQEDREKHQKKVLEHKRAIARISKQLYELTDQEHLDEKKRKENYAKFLNTMQAAIPIASAIGDILKGWTDSLAGSNIYLNAMGNAAAAIAGGIGAAFSGNPGGVVQSIWAAVQIPGQIEAQLDNQQIAKGNLAYSEAEARNRLATARAQQIADPAERERALLPLYNQGQEMKIKNLINTSYLKYGQKKGVTHQGWLDFMMGRNGAREEYAALLGEYPELQNILSQVDSALTAIEIRYEAHKDIMADLGEDAEKERYQAAVNIEKSMAFLNERKSAGRLAGLQSGPDSLQKRLALVDFEYTEEAAKIQSDYAAQLEKTNNVSMRNLLIEQRRIDLAQNEIDRTRAKAEAQAEYNNELTRTLDNLRFETDLLKAQLTASPIDDARLTRDKRLTDLDWEEAEALRNARDKREKDGLIAFYKMQRQLAKKTFQDTVDDYRESQLSKLQDEALMGLERQRELIQENLDLQIEGHEIEIKSLQAELDRLAAEREAKESKIQELEDKLRADLDKFDAADKARFIGALQGVNLTPAITEGLANISNLSQRGIDRTSGEAQTEGLKAQIDYLERASNAALLYEEITTEQHARNMQETALLRAKHAQERLKTEELNRNEVLELEEEIADAYVQYKEYEIQVINEKAQTEIEAIQDVIREKDREMQKIQENISKERAAISALEATAQDKYKKIEAAIRQVRQESSNWATDLASQAGNVDGALKSIIDTYKNMRSELNQSIDMQVNGGSTGGGTSSGSDGSGSGSGTASGGGKNGVEILSFDGGTGLLKHWENGVMIKHQGFSRNYDYQRGYTAKTKLPDGSSAWVPLSDQLYWSRLDPVSFHRGGIAGDEGWAKLLKHEMVIPPDVTSFLLEAAEARQSGPQTVYFAPQAIIKDNVIDSTVQMKEAVKAAFDDMKTDHALNSASYWRPLR